MLLNEHFWLIINLYLACLLVRQNLSLDLNLILNHAHAAVPLGPEPGLLAS